jgi:cobalt-zinc-cadmium resistance protein CzcA
MLQRILKFSIEHRFVVVLLAVLVGALGVYSLTKLPIDAVPDITNNQVQINTEMPALSPAEIEKQVTLPVETALAGIPGLKFTRSMSRNGFSQVQAVFEDSVDIYFARQQVSERLTAARESLPQGAEPQMGPISTGLGEVFMWTISYEKPNEPYITPEGVPLSNEIERASYLRTVQDWIVRPQLTNVKNVAGIDAIGGYVRQYHITPDTMKLVSYGLTFEDVITAVERNNVSRGAGFIERKGESYTVRAAGRIEDVDQIASIVVGSRGGVSIRVRDVASVAIGGEMRTGSASQNGSEVVVGTALMLIGANSRTVAADVGEKIEKIAKTLPPGIKITPVLNRTKLVDATVETIEHNLGMGALLVIVVLFLLLGNLRAAVVTALAIPLSMFITAIAMVEWKISGNLMSLGAVDFGLIVDGAVIIVENCLRRLGEKQHQLGRKLNLSERLDEVFQASREMIKPSVFGQMIIITVYLPILALTGVEGKMFKPMAITVIFALAAAFALSLTLIPALVAIVMRGKVGEKENFLIRGAKWSYLPVVKWAVKLRFVIVPAAVLLFAVSLWLFTRLGSEFVPTLDEKDIAMHAMRIPSTGITQSTKMQLGVEKALLEVPEVSLVFSKTGTAEMASDPMPPNVSDTFVILKPEKEWRSEKELDAAIARREKELAPILKDEHDHEHGGGHEHAEIRRTGHKGKVIRLLELAVAAAPGNNYEWTQPIQMRFNELIAGVRGDVAVKVFGDDFEKMQETAAKVQKVLAGVPGVADLKTEQTQGLPVMTVTPIRDELARYGLDVTHVQEAVAVAIGGREAGHIFEGDRRFDLVVRLPDSVRSDLDAIRNLPIPLPTDDDSKSGGAGPGFVPLSSVARVELSEGPNQISRENGKRRIVVQANVRGRDLGSFVDDAKKKIETEIKLPAGGWLEWGGQFENLQNARQRLTLVVPLCFLLIFLLLFSTFNDVRYALLVFSGVPLALTGGIVALYLRDMPFSISAAVGFIALSGVAVLNGLVMVTFINELRAKGASLIAAIENGSLTRLRPVLMTALVASLGFVPMALATGTGAEVQKPLATVVIGGIISSTVLTLVVLPALYRLWHKRDA